MTDLLRQKGDAGRSIGPGSGVRSHRLSPAHPAREGLRLRGQSADVSQATFFRWKARYGDLGTPEVRRLRLLEEENQKLKQLVADLSLDKKMLQDVLAKKP
jgi:putative transposase